MLNLPGVFFKQPFALMQWIKGLLPEMINLLNSTRVTITSVSSAQVKLGECVTKFRLNVANLEDLNHAIVSLSKISEIYRYCAGD